jgi:hypothetical protein
VTAAVRSNKSGFDLYARQSPPGWRGAAWFWHDAAVSISACVRFSPEDKLIVLRSLDDMRFWHSLDDVRLCRRCNQSITGRQIVVIEAPDRWGKMRLQCPTPDCRSSPGDWLYADPTQAPNYKASFSSSSSR